MLHPCTLLLVWIGTSVLSLAAAAVIVLHDGAEVAPPPPQNV